MRYHADMTPLSGVLLALLALVSWGVGDFLVQRSTRLVGNWAALFLVGTAGVLLFTPIVLPELASLSLESIGLLVFMGIVMVVAFMVDFEALREGKMAVVEPIIGVETLLTVLAAVLFASERLTPTLTALIALIFIGIVLTVTREFHHLRYHRRILERGVLFAILSAIGMAASNFLVAESSREISPLLAVWAVSVFRMLVCGGYLLFRQNFGEAVVAVRKHPLVMLGASTLDNIAWLSFAIAATLIPISVATVISGGYMALAVLLGLIIGREQVKPHQKLGIMMVIAGVLILSSFYD